MRKKVDSRIRTLVENCVKLRQRAMFVLIGDKGRDQVVNLHYMLSKASVKARPSVLWCYKKDLALSSHKKKRMKQLKKMSQRGLLDPEQEDPFALFVASTNIRYCYYNETQNILGNTYGMAVLQDFEALTPNLLARTVETVEGGGIVIMLLSNLRSLTQLYSLTMDVHARLRTDAHQTVTARFNERLVLSLASNPHCLIMDDELNVLPTSSLIRHIAPLPTAADGKLLNDPSAAGQAELADLKDSLTDTQPAGSLVSRCRTLDQAHALVTFLDAASEKTLRSTLALTASRGRGKSAALGLAIAGAIALGYANIFVTAPSPENLRTLFEFVFKGLDACGYQEHIDYDLVESTNPDWGRAVVRVNVFRAHRQTVQYIQPQHANRLAQAELLVIDEAAAIPLPLVKAMLGPYLVFLCSTVNGYEGTGRSLSLKLIQQLREQAAGGGRGKGGAAAGATGTAGAAAAAAAAGGGGGGSAGGRTFREVTLQEPIRYAPGDPVEAWLHGVLCLDAATHLPRPPAKLPHPSSCELFYVERDTLFSFHKASEAFLQRVQALLVASHYKNTPNDLLLLADAPAHQLYVLLGPVDESQNALPDVLAVLQVALEGAVNTKLAASSLARGELPQGDLIPWTIGQQYQDPDFPALSGARVVRIAVHPELNGTGYGSRALELLKRYFQGELLKLDDDDSVEDAYMQQQDGAAAGAAAAAAAAAGAGDAAAGGDSLLLSEQVKPRQGLPPLMVNISERKPIRLHYLGVSFGLTQQLYNFWQRAGYAPTYIRQSASDVTGEHTCVMLAALRHPEVSGTAWLEPFVTDFRARFMSLLGGAFRGMAPALALSILDPRLQFSEAHGTAGVQAGLVVARGDGRQMSPYDLKRLQAYSSNLVDYHLILDLLPSLARLYLSGQLPATLSYGQAAILLCLGLQQREVAEIEKDLGLPSNQVLALFNKAIRKLHGLLRAAKEAQVERQLPRPARLMAAAAAHAASAADAAASGAPLLGEGVDISLDDELEAAARIEREKMRQQFRPEDLQQFAITGADEDFARAAASGALAGGGMVSVKSSKTPESGKQSSGKQGGSGSKEGDKDTGKKHKQKQQGGQPKKSKKK
ncbi:GNAT acetyltransferase 2-domain-containing protein [Scenedesmus sp. NREL 46B-D3]|nr:GNAT acetyltransferase 2-domain-containing protein [Scenedesmus sp. NREL 46B-D3]